MNWSPATSLTSSTTFPVHSALAILSLLFLKRLNFPSLQPLHKIRASQTGCHRWQICQEILLFNMWGSQADPRANDFRLRTASSGALHQATWSEQSLRTGPRVPRTREPDEWHPCALSNTCQESALLPGHKPQQLGVEHMLLPLGKGPRICWRNLFTCAQGVWCQPRVKPASNQRRW